MNIITKNYQGKSITVQTRKGNNIKNFQPSCISNFMSKQIYNEAKKYGAIIIRTSPIPYYNCHGMTFASRRTCIEETKEINQILLDDNYEEILMNSTLPGDIIIYYADDGDVEHSGIVISEPDEFLGIPIIVSKWGCFSEVVHAANNSPYFFRNAKFYRIKI